MTAHEKRDVRDWLDGAGLSGYLVCLVYLVGGEEGETSGTGETGPVCLVCGFVMFLSLFEPTKQDTDPAMNDDV
jgi:hypothetical protein